MKKMKHSWIILFFFVSCNTQERETTGGEDRLAWINILTKIADPVLENLYQNTLKQNMPVEVTEEGKNWQREKVTHLEAVGRLINGISPWLELGADASTEGKIREKYIRLCIGGLKNAVDPDSPDCLNFTGDRQALVDAAFLAQGFLRAPVQLWAQLDEITQDRMIDSLKSTRIFKPLESNWLLFSAIIETFLLEVTGECNREVIHYALNRFDEWYKGDSWYGDGDCLHFDYYNSYVIHPMIMDILFILKKKHLIDGKLYETGRLRWIRHAEQLERMISPEGTFPAVGRSITYRTGVFHALSQAALKKELPAHIQPSQIRCALTAVIKRQINAQGTFDNGNWLQIGFCGHQPELAESYISTGSLYLCTTVFLPLGLPETDEFWIGKPADWTSKKAWEGKHTKIDKAIKK